jgi:hypothetical protein
LLNVTTLLITPICKILYFSLIKEKKKTQERVLCMNSLELLWWHKK